MLEKSVLTQQKRVDQNGDIARLNLEIDQLSLETKKVSDVWKKSQILAEIERLTWANKEMSQKLNFQKRALLIER